MPLSKNQVQVLIAGFSAQLFAGSGWIWGNVSPYVISYYYHFGGKDGLG